MTGITVGPGREVAAEAAARGLSQYQLLLYLGDLRLEHLTLVSAASLKMLSRAQLLFAISPFRNSKAQKAGLPSPGLVPTQRRHGQGQGSAETGPCGCTKGTIDCWALLVTLALGRGKNGEKRLYEARGVVVGWGGVCVTTD